MAFSSATVSVGGVTRQSEYQRVMDNTVYNRDTHLSRARATSAAAQSMANVVFTKVIFNTEVFDNLGEYDDSTGAFTATYAGYYQVNAAVLSANVAWAAVEIWQIALFKNGTEYSNGYFNQIAAAVTSQRHSILSDIIYLTAGQSIDIRVYHNQGASVNTHTSADYNYFSVHRLS